MTYPKRTYRFTNGVFHTVRPVFERSLYLFGGTGKNTPLGKIGTGQAVESLITALQDEDSSVRSRAVKALGKIGTGQAVESLITVLQDESSPVRCAAASALENLRNSTDLDLEYKELMSAHRSLIKRLTRDNEERRYPYDLKW